MPVAWCCTGSGTADCIQNFLGAFLKKCQELQPGFMPACILTDDDDAELLAIRLHSARSITFLPGHRMPRFLDKHMICCSCRITP